jgi:hypothetical protein
VREISRIDQVGNAAMLGGRWTAALTCAVLMLASGSAPAQLPATDSATCLRCHAQPSRKFHSEPTHKKFECATCHTAAAAHVADNKSKPVLANDPALCSSCHPLKPGSQPSL